MENVVDPVHDVVDAVVIPNVAYIELQLIVLQGDTHVFLLFFVTTEDPDFLEIKIQESCKHGIAERSRATGDQQNFIFEHGCPLARPMHDIDEFGPAGRRIVGFSAEAIRVERSIYLYFIVGNDFDRLAIDFGHEL